VETKEQEIMVILQEECAEVIQAVSKCIRFGIDNTYSKGSGSQRQNLVKELGDLQCMINLCVEHDIVAMDDIKNAILNKQDKLKIYSKIYNKD
jgi:NTP pyrophosphatase (non-canonical NTP hydrolase)